jgi:hypothetical protein
VLDEQIDNILPASRYGVFDDGNFGIEIHRIGIRAVLQQPCDSLRMIGNRIP